MNQALHTDYKILMAKALAELKELRTRLHESERGRSEPLAVIGLGCRYPGGADSPEAYWQLLSSGGDGICEVPAERWDIDAYYDPDPQAPGKMYCRHGGFIRDIDRFDGAFFGITPRELAGMDPQQRLLLEVAWEALEHAGQAPEALFKTSTGVFTGISSFDYAAAQLMTTDIRQISAYLGTGMALSAANGRLSYVLGLTGPSMAVDTACSSSLVAVHLACQSLRGGECDLALAGGVNVILLPELSVNFSRARMLAPDGRCKSFDAAADGYVRGEGCGVLVLKRLSDALAQGDRILALIRGSAVNQDGPSGGLTVPNGPSQEEVIRRALANAGVAAGEVGYIEAHGTGTALGDPIEVGALGKVFSDRPAGDPLLLGSVKTNIGHLEAAAGIAGLIKVVLALQHRQIPAHLHFRQPNPHIGWDRLPIEIPTRTRQWPAGKSRTAGISAFGFTGTNAHVVLQQAPAREAQPSAVDRPLHLLALSARSQAALLALAERYAEFLSAGSFQETVADVCFTANAGRSHFEQRLAVIGATAAELAAGCRSFKEGRTAEGLTAGERRGEPKIAFVFEAEGAYAGMGRDLYATAPVFRAALERCDALLQGAIVERLYGENDGDCGPADLFAVQYALCELLQSWGITPTLVMGNGLGELTAACAAGMLSLEQALALATGQNSAALVLSDPHTAMVSAAMGSVMTEAPARPDEWLRAISAPADPAAAMQVLRQQGCTLLLAVGPHPEQGDVRLPTLRQGQDDWRQLLETLGVLYTQGAAVDWQGLDRDYVRRKVAAPTYPFQRQRYWIEGLGRRRPGAPPAEASDPAYPLPGQRLTTARGDVIFSARIAKDAPAYLNDHRIHGAVVFPAAGYVEMTLAAGAQLLDSDALTMEGFEIQRPLILPMDAALPVQTILSPEADGIYRCEIFSADAAGGWHLHASSKVRRGAPDEAAPQTMAQLQANCAQALSPADLYQRFAEQGIAYGPAFQGIQQLFVNADATESLGHMRLPAGQGAAVLHPVLLDNGLQILSAALGDAAGAETLVPVGFARLTVFRCGAEEIWVHGRRHGDGDKASLRLLDANGGMLAALDGLVFRKMSRAALQQGVGGGRQAALYTERWQPAPLVQATHAAQALAGRWLILADAGGLGERLAQALQAAGAQIALAYHGQTYGSESGRFQLDALAPQDFAHLLAEAFDGRDCAGVVHLWSLDSGARTDLSAIEQGKVLGCASVLHLVQALGKSAQAPCLWLTTRGAQPAGDTSQAVAAHQTPLWGLQRVLALEHPELRSACLDLDPTPAADDVAQLLAELASTPDGEDRIAYRGGQRCVARLVRAEAPARAESACRRMMINDYGILEHLTLAPMQPRPAAQGEVQIAVRATGLNLRDVLRALGMLKDYEPQLRHAPDARFGFECAGTVTAVGEEVGGLAVGDEVIAALTEEGSLGSHVTVQAGRVVKRPAGLSPAEGATIPLAFLTALYGLAHLAGLKEGERVLIHAAAGGVGLAAVQIAKRAGARIYATASEGKWDYVKSLGVEAVFNSRSLDYAEQIMALTEGQGVDVVLNSLTGAYIPRNLAILSENGRFVEIGKIGVWDAAQVARKRPDVRYHPFDLGDVARSDPALLQRLLRDLMAAFAAGELTPLKHTVFRLADGAAAFRYMAQARHIGKVVIESDAAADMRIRPDATYLITGGLGALGGLMAEHLTQHGARHIVLCGRGPAGPAAARTIERLRRGGAHIEVMQGDMAREGDVQRLLQSIQRGMPPLKGIVHAAGVLDDGIIRDQTWARFAAVMAPKIEGAWHLQRHTRELDLDFCMLFSSTASCLGSPGQGNYAAANAFLDALAHATRRGGGRATTINWGPWEGAGMAATHKEAAARFAKLGVTPIRPADGFALLDRTLAADAAQVCAADIDWGKYAQHKTCGYLAELLRETPAAPKKPTGQATLRSALAAADSARKMAVLQEAVSDAARKVMGYDDDGRIRADEPLADQGLDSLMAVELRNLIAEGLDMALPVSLLFDCPSVDDLCRFLAQELKLDAATSAVPGQDRAAAAPGQDEFGYIDDMDAAELEAMIRKEIQ